MLWHIFSSYNFSLLCVHLRGINLNVIILYKQKSVFKPGVLWSVEVRKDNRELLEINTYK